MECLIRGDSHSLGGRGGALLAPVQRRHHLARWNATGQWQGWRRGCMGRGQVGGVCPKPEWGRTVVEISFFPFLQ